MHTHRTPRGDTMDPPVGMVSILDAGGELVGDDHYVRSPDVASCNALLQVLHPECGEWCVRPERLEPEQLEREVDRVLGVLYRDEPDPRGPMVAAVLRAVLSAAR